MATYTENYNLKKPATTDPVNIEDLNGNADIIDAALFEKQDILTFDAEPTADSTNPVTSGGVYAALQDVDNSEEMTLAQYNALTEDQKMDGTVRYITDVSVLPDAAEVGF